MIENYDSLREEYKECVADYNAALRLALARLKNLDEAMEQSDSRNPFSSIDYRIKTFESVMEKVERKAIDCDMGTIKQRIRDIAGIRIVTPFRDDIYTVANLIMKIPGISVTDKKDYVKTPKENGYASYHLHVLVEIYHPIDGSKLIPIEVQIRDKAMDMWATVEHIIKYKNPSPSPKVSERFKGIAEILARFDEMAIELRNEALQ